MKKLKTQERIINLEQKENIESVDKKNTNFVKSLICWLLLTAFVLWANSSKSQEKTAPNDIEIEKTEKVDKIKKENKSWSFMVDPTYSINNKEFVSRFQWWWNLWDLDIWWFVDFSSTNFEDWISTAFWKLTLSKKIWKKWTSAALEYTLNSESKDQVRIWMKQVFKHDKWSVFFKVYPLDNTWFKPFLLVWTSHKINKNLSVSWFVWTDIKDKVYYWELELIIGSWKVQWLVQSRTWWDYNTKPKTSLNVWARIKI